MRAPAEATEPVLAALLELAPGGVEQVDGPGWVEFAVYGAPGELPALPAGEAEVAGVRVEVRAGEVAEDWSERWRAFHRPVLVGGRLHVRPPWEPPAAARGVIDLAIDPGQAFGTGSHATTRGCLELLLELVGAGGAAGRSLADLGCGSGVVAIAAARLGFRPVIAVDHDGRALVETSRNARANGISLDRVERANLREEPPPAADVLVANLMRPLLLRVAELMTERPRALVVSGLLDREADEVAGAFAPLAERRRVSAEGWSSLLLG